MKTFPLFSIVFGNVQICLDMFGCVRMYWPGVTKKNSKKKIYFEGYKKTKEMEFQKLGVR